jgi:hypothetical protein
MDRLSAAGITAHFFVLLLTIPLTFARRHQPGSWGTAESGFDPDAAITEQAQQNVTCPPPGFQGLEPFNLKDYAGEPTIGSEL